MIKISRLIAMLIFLVPTTALSAEISGNWNFVSGGDKSSVEIIEGGDNDYKIVQKYHDGSETVYASTATKSGKDIKLVEEDSSEFWLLRADGTLELHDQYGLIPGWQSIDLDDIDPKCKILNVDTKQSVKADSSGNLIKANLTEVKVISNFIDKDQFISATRNILEDVAAKENSTQAEIWFYRAAEEPLKDHEFYAAYTPDVSKLSFRDTVWDSPNTYKQPDLWDKIAPANLCE